MPREQINFPESKQVLNAEKIQKVIDGELQIFQKSDSVTHTDPAVHVSWHNVGNDHDGHVQIALECDRSYFEQFPDEERGCRFSPVLTRSDVNKLIRVLKRARDQAYGRDE